MQILISLNANNVTKERFVGLLERLRGDHYNIQKPFGNVVFDNAKKEFINCNSIEPLKESFETVTDTVLRQTVKLMLISTDEKYVLFFRSFHPAIWLSNLGKTRILQLDDIENYYDNLIFYECKNTLKSLYRMRYEEQLAILNSFLKDSTLWKR